MYTQKVTPKEMFAGSSRLPKKPSPSFDDHRDSTVQQRQMIQNINDRVRMKHESGCGCAGCMAQKVYQAPSRNVSLGGQAVQRKIKYKGVVYDDFGLFIKQIRTDRKIGTKIVPVSSGLSEATTAAPTEAKEEVKKTSLYEKKEPSKYDVIRHLIDSDLVFDLGDDCDKAVAKINEYYPKYLNGDMDMMDINTLSDLFLIAWECKQYLGFKSQEVQVSKNGKRYIITVNKYGYELLDKRKKGSLSTEIAQEIQNLGLTGVDIELKSKTIKSVVLNALDKIKEITEFAPSEEKTTESYILNPLYLKKVVYPHAEIILLAQIILQVYKNGFPKNRNFSIAGRLYPCPKCQKILDAFMKKNKGALGIEYTKSTYLSKLIRPSERSTVTNYDNALYALKEKITESGIEKRWKKEDQEVFDWLKGMLDLIQNPYCFRDEKLVEGEDIK